MSVVVVTGSAGLIGAEAVRRFHDVGYEVIGVDNDMRATFFGPSASTYWMRQRLEAELAHYRHVDIDIRDRGAVESLFAGSLQITAVIHAAAQPSHDWAASDPRTDFEVNAIGTLNLLEATRQHCPDASFVFLSTNKVYGDRPNGLPFVETPTRYELHPDHPYHGGIREDFSIDDSTHSLFGVSKASADLLVQEYGRYFGMATACLRGGCLTGPGHSGTELHGFLAYLVKCAATGSPYTVYGYKGKQVRDNIHSSDLIDAVEMLVDHPRPAAVYNIGGGRESNCSMLEAIQITQEITGRELDWNYSDTNRRGDHIWWISDVGRLSSDFPQWQITRDVPQIIKEIYEANHDRWEADP